MFPVGEVAASTPLPGDVRPSWDALAWFTGETPLTELPDPRSPRRTLEAFRHHGIATHAAQTSARQAHERRRDMTINLDPAARERLSQTADLYERVAFDDARALKDLRTRMREQGLGPPPLPASLAHVDDARPSGEPSA
ncbi:hypothetical protein [Embleya sp. NPDC005971]|uniref:hypothetical protein n=1 Tax=Embleya sp. NPDC005971 TaxID=3156724 RepID=UPI0033EBE1BE